MAQLPTAGDLRERVAIQIATVTKGAAYNEEVLTWATVATVWARVEERTGSEPLAADRATSLVYYLVTMRTPAVTPTHKDQLLWRGKTLAVQTVTPMPQHGLIVLRCLEVTA
jgi:SPP1 family predicted phage head-tail adaptor